MIKLGLLVLALCVALSYGSSLTTLGSVPYNILLFGVFGSLFGGLGLLIWGVLGRLITW